VLNIVTIISVHSSDNFELKGKIELYNGSDFTVNNSVQEKIGKTFMLNNTLCQMLTQIPVRFSNKIISVCTYDSEVRVDIRDFFSNVPSVRGIWFKIKEWKEFCRIMYEINRAVNYQKFRQSNNCTKI
jgi:hypothetical protein